MILRTSLSRICRVSSAFSSTLPLQKPNLYPRRSFVLTAATMSTTNQAKKMKTEDQAVTNFREYLRIPTVHPDPDYEPAVDFLKRMAGELGLPIKVIEVYPKNPVVVISWEGKDPSLKSIILNSHMDVVPVFPEHWKCDPFSATKYDNGDIYARGTQDMKCVGIQYIEAIRKLIKRGEKPLRSIHMTFVPDEEVSGHKGMKLFVDHPEFKKLNMGFGLDEGLANPTEKFTVYYGERAVWWLIVTCKGHPGHGSRFLEDTAAEKLQSVLNSFLDYRESEKEKLKTCKTCRFLGDVTTVNLTGLEGGVQHNVVPSEFKAKFDIRVSPKTDMEDLERKIDSWIKEAGEEVTYEFTQKGKPCETPIGDGSPWWRAFDAACKDEQIEIVPEIFPAATDSAILRLAGYPCYGFSPMNNTPVLLHDNNEYLNEDIFLRGIEIYEGIIPTIANVTDGDD
ncbi:aminoacylase-1-like isoform X2 [Amphiura filiformis]|uniref:aminoacylase-1-like isoform X2 n=1 Tax=Amphiura filiformis TaxID=82378 RepID=UPI003B2287CF